MWRKIDTISQQAAVESDNAPGIGSMHLPDIVENVTCKRRREQTERNCRTQGFANQILIRVSGAELDNNGGFLSNDLGSGFGDASIPEGSGRRSTPLRRKVADKDETRLRSGQE
jgi:hypothetical protein